MTTTVEHASVAGWSVLSPRGQVDAATAPVLRSALESAAAGAGARVLVDLGGVSFLDSTGLGVLVGGLRRCRVAGGALRVVCTDAAMLELFRVTGLLEVLDVHRDLAAALRHPLAPPQDVEEPAAAGVAAVEPSVRG